MNIYINILPYGPSFTTPIPTLVKLAFKGVRPVPGGIHEISVGGINGGRPRQVFSGILAGYADCIHHEFWSAHKKGEGAATIDRGVPVGEGAPAGPSLVLKKGLAKPVNWAGVSIAAWGMFAEGVEIMIVWLAITLKQGMATASLGVLIGIGIIGLIALILGKAGIFEKIPPKYLDCIAGTMVTLYGIYFLYGAITGTLAAL